MGALVYNGASLPYTRETSLASIIVALCIQKETSTLQNTISPKKIYDFSAQCLMGYWRAYIPFNHLIFNVASAAGFDGIQHMPLRPWIEWLLGVNKYLQFTTSLHESWLGPFSHARNKRKARLLAYLLLHTTESIVKMRRIQDERKYCGLSPLPNVLYPESDIQTVEAFSLHLVGLDGARVVQVESKQFEWYDINPDQPEALRDFFKDQGWEACFDLIHFVRDIPTSFEHLLTAMASTITHVHIRAGKDVTSFEQAVQSVKNLLAGIGVETEQLSAVASQCPYITHVTMEVPCQILVAATGCGYDLESLAHQYSLLLGRAKAIFS